MGPESDYAESWEIADHRQGQSVVAGGPLAGLTLHELVESRAHELFGRHAPQYRFPLIFKYLDCQRDLSVQVHPNDAAAARLDPPDLGKTEAWIILAADPGSRIYAGLRTGCDRPALQRALAAGAVESCLHSFEAQPGQCVFIPAGTVHALGAGLVVAEIQQASDTTYRLHDWGRVGPDGKPRQLHIDESLASIDYAATAVQPRTPQPTDQSGRDRLVTCDKFILDRCHTTQSLAIGGDERFHIVSVLEGSLVIRGEDERALGIGDTVLLPASVGTVHFVPAGHATLLDAYLP
jgi:mannose-6-phosphate isomerase